MSTTLEELAKNYLDAYERFYQESVSNPMMLENLEIILKSYLSDEK